MKTNVRFFVALAVSLVSLALSACGSPKADASTQVKTTDSSIPTIKPGTLQVAIATADPPSSYLESGKPAGYDVDIIKDIAKNLKLKIEWKTADYSVHIPNIANGTWDTSTQGALVTAARKKQVAFSKPIDYAQAVLVSLKSKKFSTLGNASGERIGIYTDAHQSVAEKDISNVKIVKFQDQVSALNALRIGQIDGYINGQNSAIQQAKENKDISLSIPVTTGRVSIPLPKSNKKMVQAFDVQLDKLAARGTLYSLHKRYYPTADIPVDLKSAYKVFKTK